MNVERALEVVRRRLRWTRALRWGVLGATAATPLGVLLAAAHALGFQLDPWLGPLPLAAACLLPQGPRLWLSHSERAWPKSRALPEQSEGPEHGPFDAAQSVRLLVELQNRDGSFGSHSGAAGYGYWDGTITAFAAEALWRWLDHLRADPESRQLPHRGSSPAGGGAQRSLRGRRSADPDR